MKRTIEVEFSEDEPVEIAVTASVGERVGNGSARRQFWLGWQLFAKE